MNPDTLPANGTSQATITIFPKNNSDTLLASGLQVILSNSGAGSIKQCYMISEMELIEATITAPIAIGTDTISAV